MMAGSFRCAWIQGPEGPCSLRLDSEKRLALTEVVVEVKEFTFKTGRRHSRALTFPAPAVDPVQTAVPFQRAGQM